jgi:predicted CopG family antitoxin
LVTKTITITKSAYEALLREKRELSLTNKHGTLKECLGLWKLSRKERKIFKEIKKSWEESDREMKRRLGS